MTSRTEKSVVTPSLAKNGKILVSWLESGACFILNVFLLFLLRHHFAVANTDLQEQEVVKCH